MIINSGQGWLTTLADLSIILFMVTAADLSTAQQQLQNKQAATPAPQVQEKAMGVATAEPVAIYRPAQGAMPLAAWLASQPADDRQRLTVMVRHDGKDAAGAIAQGMKLIEQARQAGRSPRLIVEQGTAPEIMAFLAYDADPGIVARNLRGTAPPATPTTTGPDQPSNREEDR